MSKAIEVVDLTKQYKTKKAVAHLSLTINKGELFALLGVNGAGKTTLIKMLSCITKPTSGNAYLFGKSILTEPQEVKKLIAVSPQETAIAPNLTVIENLELMASVCGFHKEKAKQKTKEIMEQLSLTKVKKQRSKTLSGGWKRRLSIGMALISEPSILFLDEPTLGLDILARRELWAIIKKLKKSTTIILTTHYLEEAEALSDRICIMRDGQIKAIGSVNQLKERAGTASFEDAFVRYVMEGESS